MTGSDQIEWMDGGHFLVWHSTVTSGAMGNFSATAYMGYNANDKVYTYDDFNNMGEAEHSKAPSMPTPGPGPPTKRWAARP